MFRNFFEKILRKLYDFIIYFYEYHFSNYAKLVDPYYHKDGSISITLVNIFGSVHNLINQKSYFMLFDFLTHQKFPIAVKTYMVVKEKDSENEIVFTLPSELLIHRSDINIFKKKVSKHLIEKSEYYNAETILVVRLKFYFK